MNILNPLKGVFTVLLIIGIALTPNISLAASADSESQIASLSQMVESLRGILTSLLDSVSKTAISNVAAVADTTPPSVPGTDRKSVV